MLASIVCSKNMNDDFYGLFVSFVELSRKKSIKID